MRRPRADLHDGSDCGEARIRAKMLAGPRAEPRLTRRKIAKGRATFTDSNEQGVFMHVAKRRTMSAALGATLVALCTTGLNSALATEKAAAVRASAQAQSSGSTLAVANNILNRWEAIAQAAGAHSAVWRELFGTQLNQMSEQALRRLEMVSAEGSPKAAYARFTEAFAGAQMQRFASEESAKTVLKDLGSTTNDQVFIPITPCRVVDTRASSGGTGPISAGNERDFYFYNVNPSWSWQTGASGIGAQGGQPGVAVTVCPGTTTTAGGGTLGAAAPSAAVATVTAVGPTAAGNLLVWGGAGSPPTSSALNFSAGQTLANTTVIPAGGRSGGALDFTVRYNGPSGQAEIVVDVVGYFVQSGATALQCNLQTANGTGTSNFATGTNFQLNFPSCTTGYTATGYGCGYAGAIPAAAYLQESSPFWGYCNWFNNSGTTLNRSSFSAETRCCRVPGQ